MTNEMAGRELSFEEESKNFKSIAESYFKAILQMNLAINQNEKIVESDGE